MSDETKELRVQLLTSGFIHIHGKMHFSLPYEGVFKH